MLWLKLLLIRHHCAMAAEFRWPQLPCPKGHPRRERAKGEFKNEASDLCKTSVAKPDLPRKTRAVCLALARALLSPPSPAWAKASLSGRP